MDTEVKRTPLSPPEALKQHLQDMENLKRSMESNDLISDKEGTILSIPDSNLPLKKEEYTHQIPPSTTEDTPKIPIAGEYAIERSKEPQPDFNIPPACYMYDEDRPWVLGKLNKAALDVPEPAEPVALPKHVLNLLDALEHAANQVIEAQIKYSKEEGANKTTFNSNELYEKEKAIALAALQVSIAAAEDRANANVPEAFDVPKTELVIVVKETTPAETPKVDTIVKTVEVNAPAETPKLASMVEPDEAIAPPAAVTMPSNVEPSEVIASPGTETVPLKVEPIEAIASRGPAKMPSKEEPVGAKKTLKSVTLPPAKKELKWSDPSKKEVTKPPVTPKLPRTSVSPAARVNTGLGRLITTGKPTPSSSVPATASVSPKLKPNIQNKSPGRVDTNAASSKVIPTPRPTRSVASSGATTGTKKSTTHPSK